VPPPVGWSGPFALATGTSEDPPPDCPIGWAAEASGHAGLVAPDPVCGCECTPQLGSCVVSVDYFVESGCVTLLLSEEVMGSCTPMTTPASHSALRATAVARDVGCTPNPTESVPPLAWAQELSVCAPTMVGPACGDGGTCAPPPPAGFAPRWCVAADGDIDCPPGYDSTRHVMHRDVDDTRACTTCTCEIQGTPICPGGLMEYAEGFCVIDLGSVPVDGSCQASANASDESWGVAYDGAPPTLVCGTTASGPTGAAMPTDPLTICCEP
jgi:hypothetical protein